MITIPKSITVNVTQAIIDNAKQRESKTCMIADAIRLRGPEYSSVNVTAETVTFNRELADGSKYRFSYPLPGWMAERLIAFDEDKNSVEPFKGPLQNGTYKPVPKLGPRFKSKHGQAVSRKPRKSHGVKRVNRRYHGLKGLIKEIKVIEKSSEEGAGK